MASKPKIKGKTVEGDRQLFSTGKAGFRQDPFTDALEKWRFKHDPDYAEAMLPTNDLSKAFIGGLHQRIVVERKNIVISIRGKARTGKSGFGMGIYHLIKSMLQQAEDIGDIYFTQEEFRYKRSQTIKSNTTLVVDEDFRFNTGIGSSSVNEFLDFINQTIGYEKVNLIYIGVESQQPNVFCTFEVLNYDRASLTTKALVLDEYGRPRGHVRLPAHFVKGYEEKKSKFTKNILLNEYRIGSEYVSKLADEIEKDLGDNLVKYPQEALRGYIREKFKKLGLQENQLYGVFQILLSKKVTKAIQRGVKIGRNAKQEEDE